MGKASLMNYTGAIQPKLHVGTTIFSVMSALANEHNAINLSQGFPDFPVSPELIDLVHQNMKDGHNQYAPMQGYIGLREVIAHKTQSLYGAQFNPATEITITAGATQAIYTAITALIHEGDEVIVFTPAYDCYVPAIELAGGIPIFIPLHPPEFKVDWEGVRKLVNHHTRMIIVNTPHNPTGTIWDIEDIHELEKTTRDTDIMVLSDEVYQHIVFDEKRHQSAARSKELSDRSIIVGSFGKTLHATGWKVGFAMGPERLMKEFNKVHQFVTFAVNHPVQRAIATHMENADNYLYISPMYQAKRDLFLTQVQDTKFKIIPSSGTYFQLLDYSEISDMKDVDYAKKLTMENGLASIPTSVFYNNPNENKVLRFCFAKRDETLLAAGDILRQIGG